MFITNHIVPKSKILDSLFPILQESYKTTTRETSDLLYSAIKPFLDFLIDDLFCYIEYPYIDRVFRDSYYSYYSSKLRSYQKDTIKICFFEGEIEQNQFLTHAGVNYLKSIFRGFIVLRPTVPHIIGRNVISPIALKSKNFGCRTAKIPVTVNSIGFEIEGFPHCSQDNETILCSETSLWVLMEYFSHKYVDYAAITPSKILNTLKRASDERLLPSSGLKISQIAFALKEFGFGPKIYDNKDFDFTYTISNYIDSGIPLILGVSNTHKRGKISHAVVCIGHELLTETHYNSLQPSQNACYHDLVQNHNVTVYDNDEIRKNFIYIDDNFPPFQRAKLTFPFEYYSHGRYNSDDWQQCEIAFFIAPLHLKIYIDSPKAKSIIIETFRQYFSRTLIRGSEIFFRIFLASSKSFKEAVALNLNYPAELQASVLAISMPKFIWIAELSSKELKKTEHDNNVNNGLIIIDATETISRKSLLLAAFNDIIVCEHPGTLKYEPKDVILQFFKSYRNNLNSF